jgi:xeroderma pigmentosum group C-complementing protein
MIVEARRAGNTGQTTDVPERPLKRRRPGEGRPARKETPSGGKAVKPVNRRPEFPVTSEASDGDGDDVQFEDVAIPKPTVQTMERDSDGEDDEDIDYEDVAIESAVPLGAGVSEGPKPLNLDLSAHMASMAPRRADRRKAISREERERRVEVHKIHLVCLLAHVELRNRWCNDPKVQDALRPLLPQKTVAALIPRASLNQFGRSESLKKGIQEAKDLFKMKFTLTERALRRALWAEDEEQLKNVRRPHPRPLWARLIQAIVPTSRGFRVHV